MAGKNLNCLFVFGLFTLLLLGSMSKFHCKHVSKLYSRFRIKVELFSYLGSIKFLSVLKKKKKKKKKKKEEEKKKKLVCCAAASVECALSAATVKARLLLLLLLPAAIFSSSLILFFWPSSLLRSFLFVGRPSGSERGLSGSWSTW